MQRSFCDITEESPGTKLYLYDQRTILAGASESLASVFRVPAEHGGVQHRRVAEFSAVSPAE